MQGISIKGFQGTSLIDFPGRVSSIIFTGGCNFRCGYCYNPDLVTGAELPDLCEEDILRALARRRGFIDGVVVTGGEPAIQPNLIGLLEELRGLGVAIKLDTNGSRPEVLEQIISRRLADYVAMDYKAPAERLHEVANVQNAGESVLYSARMLIACGIDHEFRTTVHPDLHGPEDLRVIADEIEGARAYYIQQFMPVKTLDPALSQNYSFPLGFFDEVRNSLTALFQLFEMRNVREQEADNMPGH